MEDPGEEQGESVEITEDSSSDVKETAENVQSEALNERQIILFKAELAEKASRFDDMAMFTKELAETDEEMSTVEQRMFASAYKQVIISRRKSWRTINDVLSDPSMNHDGRRRALKSAKCKIEEELLSYCREALSLISDHLIPNSSADEGQVTYRKLQGDYHRYLAEFQENDSRKLSMEASSFAYQEAHRLAQMYLELRNPVRLGVALNYSVFLHDMKASPEDAVDIARQAFDNAISEQKEIKDGSETKIILGIIGDNLNAWRYEMAEA